MINLQNLTTEKRNEKTMNLDQLSIDEAMKLMNEEDQNVALAVKEALPKIKPIIESTIEAFNKGGRLFYIGAGTSGRLGILDASECVPTFGVSPEMVQGIIAGGKKAMTIAVEGAEDSLDLGKEDLEKANQQGEKYDLKGLEQCDKEETFANITINYKNGKAKETQVELKC